MGVISGTGKIIKGTAGLAANVTGKVAKATGKVGAWAAHKINPFKKAAVATEFQKEHSWKVADALSSSTKTDFEDFVRESLDASPEHLNEISKRFGVNKGDAPMKIDDFVQEATDAFKNDKMDKYTKTMYNRVSAEKKDFINELRTAQNDKEMAEIYKKHNIDYKEGMGDDIQGKYESAQAYFMNELQEGPNMRDYFVGSGAPAYITAAGIGSAVLASVAKSSGRSNTELYSDPFR